MTQFGKHLEKSLTELAYEPIWNAVRDQTSILTT